MARSHVTADAPSASAPTEAASSSPLQVRSSSLALKLVKIISHMPYQMRSAAGWLLGSFVGLLPTRERNLAVLQLKAFLPEVPATSVARKVFANTGRTILESLSLAPVIQQRDTRVGCENWDQVEVWLRDERPIIALTAHTGNWDLLAAYVISRGVQLTTIGREARNADLQGVLEWIREGYGIETIWRSDRSGLKRLIQCLKERRVVAALIDQDTRVDSTSVPFFGAPAKTPVALISLGKKVHARFVSAFLFRTGNLRYTLFIQELPDAPTEQEILTTYHQHLEKLVRRFPDQWVWFHKRWRTGADGKTLSSKEYESWLQTRVTQQRKEA